MSLDGPGGVALVTGLTGQDGHYLSELLADKRYAVHGGQRADLLDTQALARVIDETEPDVVVHLAAISSVAASWEDPAATTNANALPTVAPLDACLRTQDREIFAGAQECPQAEATALQPISPYGAAKAFGHMICQVYRAKGLEASNSVLYNHESPIRPDRDPALHRLADRADMVGDAGKAVAILDWRPTKTFHDIVGAMVDSDLRQEQTS